VISEFHKSTESPKSPLATISLLAPFFFFSPLAFFSSPNRFVRTRVDCVRETPLVCRPPHFACFHSLFPSIPPLPTYATPRFAPVCWLPQQKHFSAFQSLRFSHPLRPLVAILPPRFFLTLLIDGGSVAEPFDSPLLAAISSFCPHMPSLFLRSL